LKQAVGRDGTAISLLRNQGIKNWLNQMAPLEKPLGR